MGTLVVGLILLGIVGGVILNMMHDKKSGKSCAGCTSCSKCRSSCGHQQGCSSGKVL